MDFEKKMAAVMIAIFITIIILEFVVGNYPDDYED